MTEEEWLACKDPQRIICEVAINCQECWEARRGRLFAVACCRQLLRLPDDRLAGVISVAEGYADGVVDEAELGVALGIALDALEWEARHDMSSWKYHAAEVIAAALAHTVVEYALINGLTDWVAAECAAASVPDASERVAESLAALVRDLVGNPFRPITLDPSWLTSTVTTLARIMYDTRDFSAMPILADAIQDAGCDDETILTHCRGPGPHVRGCFLIDLLTGKG